MCFMAIYGVLHIQAGDNPRILWDTMTSIMPKDVVVDFEDICIRSDEKAKKSVDFELLFRNKTRLMPKDNGYFEVMLCEEIIQILDKLSLQRFLIDFMDYRLVDVMCAFSGKTRRIIFDNLSGNNSKALAEILVGHCDEYITDEYEMNKIKNSATSILSRIHELETHGEIVICINPHTNFLMLAMEMVGQKEKKLETRKKDCDTLINMLHSYKDHLEE